MAHVSAARVRETSTTTGTNDFALGGAVTNFRAFSSVMANGDTCWYAAVLENGGWEEGFGTWVTGGTLQRTAVLSSSAGGTTKVSFGAGSKDIFITVPGTNIFHGSVTSKSTPVDADSISIWDSVAGALARLTWANLKATLKSSAANFWGGTNDGTFLTPKNVADASARVVLTSGTTIATDASLGRIFYVVLGHNATFSAPTNLIDGVTYTWIIKQDGTGSRTGAFNSIFRFPSAPTLSTAAGSVDIVSGVYNSTDTKIEARFSKGS